MRTDGRFIPIPRSKVRLIREAKVNGYSLNEIALTFGIGKSTASLYCRDLFWHPNRIYATEAEAREAILLRGLGTDHSKYKVCIDCGVKIRNERSRCLKCNLSYQEQSGERLRFIESGLATRTTKGNLLYTRRKSVIMRFTEFNEGDILTVIMPKGSGYKSPFEATVIEKGLHGVVLLEKSDGKRFYANSRRIKRMVKTSTAQPE